MRKRRRLTKLFSVILTVALLATTLPINILQVRATENAKLNMENSVSNNDSTSDEEVEKIQGYMSSVVSTLSEQEKYGITEEQLALLAPEYLYNDLYDGIIKMCSEMSWEAMDSVSKTDEAMAAYMYALKEGIGLYWNEIWANCGLATDTYSSFEKDAAKELVFEYLNANQNLTKTSEAVGEQFGIIDTVYDLTTKQGKEAFQNMLLENDESLTETELKELTNAMFENTDKVMKYANEVSELYMLTMSLIEMQMIEIRAIDDLIVIHNKIKSTTMRDALVQLRNEITVDIGDYFVQNYLKDKVLEMIQKEFHTAFLNLTVGEARFSSLSVMLGKMVTESIAGIYESVKPSVSDIVSSQILYQYWQNSDMAVQQYKYLFRTGKGTKEDIRLYEAAMNFNAACTKVWMSKAKNLVKNSNKNLYIKMECWEESLCSQINYDLYLNNCLSNAQKAIEAGTLILEEDSATIKDQNGTVIDDNYDSTESIKARFEAIQAQYVPNVGQTWESDWGGAIQCFGFARMVFYKLFDCNMPAQYVRGENYRFANENNVVLVGQLVGDNVSATSAKSLLQQGKLGDIIQASGSTYGQHTMVFVSADDTGVTVYDCNARLNGAAPCTIHQWTISWNTWASWYGTGTADNMNGISLYRAGNYATIYGDGENLFYDDSVNFVIEDGVLVEYTGWQSIVEIPEGVTEIGESAFEYNTTMHSVSIPNGVTTIGWSSFEGCSSLLCVVIPDSVTEIGGWAFSNCTKLQSVKMSKNLETLDENSFYNCDMLESIYIPKSLMYGGDYSYGYGGGGAFNGCSGLKTVTFEEGTTEIAYCLFYGCDGLESIVMPDSVTTIGAYAFDSCSNLKEIVLPDSVTEIGDSAFSNCTKLERVKLSKNLERLNSNAFYDCDMLESIFIPKSLRYGGDYCNGYGDGGAFNGCSGLKTVTFEEGTTEIAYCLFYGCDGLESIVMSDSVTTIGAYAFDSCSNLKEVVLPDSVTEIGDRAFSDCTKLQSVKLSKNLTQIGTSAFNGCSLLSEIEIPDSVFTIEGAAFYNCVNLQSVKLSQNLHELASDIFSGCKALEHIDIPTSIIKIQNEAFYDCDSLVMVIIPNSVTFINYGAFMDCDRLQKVTFSDSITALGGSIFESCDELKTVTLGLGLTEIPSYTFADCGKLTNIVIPYNVTAIDDYAFKNCTSLTEITIPRKTTTISSNAFSYPAQMILYGVVGTYGETYAREQGMTFVDRSVAAESVQLPQSAYEVNRGSTITLLPTITPANFTDLISYKSTNTSVATVDENGNVKGVEVGTANIKITVGGVSTSCKITVKQPVTSISLNRTSLTMEALETYNLTASSYPIDANDRSVQWTSSDEKVATVSRTGTVTALSKGTCTITASAMDGSGVTRNCNVTVTNNAHVAATVEELQSSHPYENNCSDVWQYCVPGVYALDITFSEQTSMEEDFDYLYLLDGNNNELVKYTGAALAGKTIRILGDTVRIRLQTDEASGEYGFKVEKVTVMKNAPSYTIVYNKNNSGATGTMSTQKVECDSTVSLKANAFKRSGYTFVGWNTKADGTGKSYGNKASVKNLSTTDGATVILYAQWKKDTYQITYNINGGTNNSSNPKTYTVTTSTITLKTPTRNGYAFSGWYSDKALTKKVTQITKGSTGNKTLYAKWTPNKYTIRFDKNGATSGSMSALKNRKYGTSYTLSNNKFKRKGYTFTGWNTRKNGKGKTYKNKASVKNLVSTNGKTVTLYARWKKDSYKITYKLNIGKNNSSNPKKYDVTTKTITLKAPTRKGYTFKGWYSDSKFKKKVSKISKGSTGNITLYAQWEKVSYQITYKLNSGKNNSSNPKKYDVTTKTITLKTPTRKGYTFKGWYSDSKFKKKVTKIKKGSTGNITLYAKWVKK